MRLLFQNVNSCPRSRLQRRKVETFYPFHHDSLIEDDSWWARASVLRGTGRRRASQREERGDMECRKYVSFFVKGGLFSFYRKRGCWNNLCVERKREREREILAGASGSACLPTFISPVVTRLQLASREERRTEWDLPSRPCWDAAHRQSISSTRTDRDRSVPSIG